MLVDHRREIDRVKGTRWHLVDMRST